MASAANSETNDDKHVTAGRAERMIGDMAEKDSGPINQDEAKVPAYVLPDPLRCADGTPVADAKTWRERRRPELLELFERLVYGRPPAPVKAGIEVREDWTPALDGRALRRQVRLTLGKGERAARVDVLFYLPVASGPVPCFVGLNYQGNHGVHSDPAIFVPDGWVTPVTPGGEPRASEKTRGCRTDRWQVEMLVSRGYGLVTAAHGDIVPSAEVPGVEVLAKRFPRRGKDDDTGAIAVWAWGLSRILDHLATEPRIDARRLVVVGHSRLGKTALWAGACDPRWALVISNDSGEGGAALSRRCFGETVRAITTRFPHWFCPAYARFSGREAEMPIDQHELMALIAPRPLYVASAAEDLWADPRGEFLAARAASPVYRLLGVEGLPANEWPPVSRPVMGGIGYHVRPGPHNVTAEDWAAFLDFADKHLHREPTAR